VQHFAIILLLGVVAVDPQACQVVVLVVVEEEELDLVADIL
jgi:hypothetical protein